MGKKEGVILLNKVFNGSFLEGNLGHEFINILQSDNNKFYMYATPNGNVDIKRQNIDYIVNIRNINDSSKFKILSYGKVIKNHNEISFVRVSRDKRYAIESLKSEEQKSYIKRNQLNYGGIPLNEILDKVKSDEGSDFPYYYTFETETTEIPVEDINFEWNHFRDKTYLEESDHKTASSFKNILDIINDKTKWQTAKKINFNEISKVNKEKKFLEIIRKEYDENIISNLLVYFLEKDKMFWTFFSKHIFKLEKNEMFIEILREKSDIDIFIVTSKRIIVIENKIRSSIIVYKSGDNTQLDKYYDIVKKLLKTNRQKYNNINFSDCKFYLFKPVYNKKSENVEIDNYEVILYDKIYQIANDYKKNNNDIMLYFYELIRVLEIHSSPFDNQIYEAQTLKLFNIISIINNK